MVRTLFHSLQQKKQHFLAVLAQVDLIESCYDQFHQFRRADLTYFHLFPPILSGSADLFSPILAYFVSQYGSVDETPNAVGPFEGYCAIGD